MDRLLQQLYTKEQLAGMSVAAKVWAVYQCSLESEYIDTSEARRAAASWAAAVPSLQRVEGAREHESTKQCASYVKSLLETGKYFSLRSLFGK